jgi:hypothetical protein
MVLLLLETSGVIQRDILKPPVNKVDVALGRPLSAFRLLLEGVDDIEGFCEFHRIDGPVGVAVEILDQLHDTAAEASKRFRGRRVLAGLGKKQFEP